MPRKYTGWFPNFRRFLDGSDENKIFNDNDTWKIFSLLQAWACWEPANGMELGQVITSYYSIARKAGVSYSKVRRSVKKLSDSGLIFVVDNDRGLLIECLDLLLKYGEKNESNQEKRNNFVLKAEEKATGVSPSATKDCREGRNNFVLKAEEKATTLKEVKKLKNKECIYLPTNIDTIPYNDPSPTRTVEGGSGHGPKGEGDKEKEIDICNLSGNIDGILQSTGITDTTEILEMAKALKIPDHVLKVTALEFRSILHSGKQTRNPSRYFLGWLKKLEIPKETPLEKDKDEDKRPKMVKDFGAYFQDELGVCHLK